MVGVKRVGEVVHTCNPSLSGGRYNESCFKTSLGKKLVRPYLKNKLGISGHVYNSSYSGGRRRMEVQCSLGQKRKTLSENKVQTKGLMTWIKW
jgi:hypothetical protein